MVAHRLRKFTFGSNGVEFTHSTLIKCQALTYGFNIHLLGTQSKLPTLLPDFQSIHHIHPCLQFK